MDSISILLVSRIYHHTSFDGALAFTDLARGPLSSPVGEALLGQVDLGRRGPLRLFLEGIERE